MSCTGSIRSTASTVAEVLQETRDSDVSERGASRADDKTSEAAMEDRKRNGYF
jgi:sulfate adenylyltransferase subunit 2